MNESIILYQPLSGRMSAQLDRHHFEHGNCLRGQISVTDNHPFKFWRFHCDACEWTILLPKGITTAKLSNSINAGATFTARIGLEERIRFVPKNA